MNLAVEYHKKSVNVQQYHYRPGQALRVPGNSQNYTTGT
jgi:hypothetical protein